MKLISIHLYIFVFCIIIENELEEESKLCRDQLSFLGEKIKLPYGLMREARQDHDISLLKIPDLHLKVEEEREKLQQLADEIKQVNEKEERLNTLLEEIKANQYHVDRKERLFAQMDVFEAQKAKCSYQLDENVEEGTSLEEMDEEISKAQEKLEVVLQQLKVIFHPSVRLSENCCVLLIKILTSGDSIETRST